MKHLRGNKYVCPACNGKGATYDHFFGVCTFGLGYLIQAGDNEMKDTCSRCGGRGYIEIK